MITEKKTREEIRNMSEDEFWDYINRPNPHPINKEKKPQHFNTKEEWLAYFSDGMEVHEFFNKIMEEYGC